MVLIRKSTILNENSGRSYDIGLYSLCYSLQHLLQCWSEKLICSHCHARWIPQILVAFSLFHAFFRFARGFYIFCQQVNLEVLCCKFRKHFVNTDVPWLNLRCCLSVVRCTFVCNLDVLCITSVLLECMCCMYRYAPINW